MLQVNKAEEMFIDIPTGLGSQLSGNKGGVATEWKGLTINEKYYNIIYLM